MSLSTEYDVNAPSVINGEDKCRVAFGSPFPIDNTDTDFILQIGLQFGFRDGSNNFVQGRSMNVTLNTADITAVYETVSDGTTTWLKGLCDALATKLNTLGYCDLTIA